MKKLLFLLCLPTLLTAMEGSHVSPIKKQRIDQSEYKLNKPRSLASLATQALGGISQIKDQETRNAHYQATIDLLCNSNLPKDQATHMLYQLPKEVVSENKELLEDWFNAAFKHDEKSKKDLEDTVKLINRPEKQKEYRGGINGHLSPAIDPKGAFIVNERGGIASIDDLENTQVLAEIGETNPSCAFNAEGDYFAIGELKNEAAICLFKRDGKKWVKQFKYSCEKFDSPTHNLYDRKESEEKLRQYLSDEEDIDIFVDEVCFSPCGNYLSSLVTSAIEVLDIKGNLLFVDVVSRANLSWSNSETYFAYHDSETLVVVEMDRERKVVHKKYEIACNVSTFAFSPDESYIAVGCEDGTIKSYALNNLAESSIGIINNGASKIDKLVITEDGSFIVAQAGDTVTVHPSLPLTGRNPLLEEVKTIHPTLLGGLLVLNKSSCEDMDLDAVVNRIVYPGVNANFALNKDNHLAVAFDGFVNIFSLNDNFEEPVAKIKLLSKAKKIRFKENCLCIVCENPDCIIIAHLNEGSTKDIESLMKIEEHFPEENNCVSKDGRLVVACSMRFEENRRVIVSSLWNYGISKQSFYNLDVQQRALIIELVNLQQAGKAWPSEWEFPQDVFDRLPVVMKGRLKGVSKPVEKADVDVLPIKNGKEEE